MAVGEPTKDLSEGGLHLSQSLVQTCQIVLLLADELLGAFDLKKHLATGKLPYAVTEFVDVDKTAFIHIERFEDLLKIFQLQCLIQSRPVFLVEPRFKF